jgi:hypothetical protein
VTLYTLGHRRASTETAPAVALCPFLAAGQGGVLLRGGF